MTAKREEYPGLPRRRGPIRTAVVRGLAVVLPPLLTIVIFIWIAGTINSYVLQPFTAMIRDTIVWSIADIRTYDELSAPERGLYREITNGQAGGKRTKCVPVNVYRYVEEHKQVELMPTSARDVYRKYVELRFLQPYQVIPYFLCGFTLVLYLLGKFMAAGVGRFFWGTFERGIARLPLIRNVYSSVKQVSDFILASREVRYSRVVAVEWPRKDVWCLALVTGSSFEGIREVVGEEVLSVLVPTSPMPMTGFTVTVKKSETVDLDITIDQAIQFIVSCGVVAQPDDLRRMRSSPAKPPDLIAASDSNSGNAG
jgi:uncharacterized membrane protein